MALTLTVATVPSFNIDALMKLIVDLIEVSSSVKGQVLLLPLPLPLPFPSLTVHV